METLNTLIDKNPKVGALISHMLQSDSNMKAGSADYLNKFEVVKGLLADLKLDISKLETTDYETLCPILMNAILIQNAKLEQAPKYAFDNLDDFIDLSPLDANKSRELDEIFSTFKYLEKLDKRELLDRFKYTSVFARKPRLEKLVLAKTLLDLSQLKNFEPLPFWVKLVDTNGIQED